MNKYLFANFMVLIVMASSLLTSCDNDDIGSGNNDSEMVSVKYAATGAINTYHVIRANYVDYSAGHNVPDTDYWIPGTNEMSFSAAFSEDKDALTGWYFQFYIEKYKDTADGSIKEYTGLADLHVGTHLVISSRNLFYCLEGGNIDDAVYGASDPHGDVIVKSIIGKNITLELVNFSFKRYGSEYDTIINGVIEYIPD
ncbi:hypothetical protein HU824_03320 [Bacteroides sp. L10-4]|nr:hypothetical protein [Bacteroides sp. L10-4]NVK92266.1 hypothetical protein [Bacteroides sp. L10-4]